MQFRLHFATAALLVGVVLSGAPKANAKDIDERAALAGRQQIRAELSDAMSDGRIGRMEQYRILLHGREVLPPEDLLGLERTLDRLASAQVEILPPKKKLATEGGSFTTETIPPGKLSPTPNLKYDDGEPSVVPQTQGNFSQSCSDEDCECDVLEGQFFDRNGVGRGPLGYLGSLEMFSSVDAFKGPMDVAGANGNFGLGLGLNFTIPVFRRAGIGFQAGANVIMSDFHGTLFTNSGIRTQNFTSVGLFQRIPQESGSVNWGFTYDWLFDDYYDKFNFGQFRVKLGWEMNRWNEIGIWTSIREHGDSGLIDLTNFGGGFVPVNFKPVDQGNLYWRHTWLNEASLTARLGISEEPGEMIFGGDGKIPISPRLAVTGSFSYILPSARGGLPGLSEELWNVSVGVEFVPGKIRRGSDARFTPVLPVADNGSFGIREVLQ